jgi:CHAD domain-containing protein
VAGRRLDAILRQFEDFLPAVLVGIRATLKKVLRALGKARDLDVALLELESFNRALSQPDRAHLEPLKRHLIAERSRARHKMLASLDSKAVQRDFGRLTLALTHPAADILATPTTPALDAVPKLIRARYKKVRKAADRLTPDSSMEAYHEVRGEVKKLRYALETVAVIFGKPAGEMLGSLRRWQEKLGRQQDADVAARRLQALAAEAPKSLPPETLFLMGRLAAHYAERALKARKRHPRAYRKVRGRWKTLKAKLVQPTASAAEGP